MNCSSEKIHTLRIGVRQMPHTSLEPLSSKETIVIGGDSWIQPDQDADSLIVNTVSTTSNFQLASQHERSV